MDATKTYNRIMEDIGYEYATIGTSLSEGTENWNLRDMVSECQYHLDCCYEDGNVNSDGMTISRYMDIYGDYYDEAIEAHKEWLSMTNRLRRFINKYKSEAMKMKCTVGHCSIYD